MDAVQNSIRMLSLAPVEACERTPVSLPMPTQDNTQCAGLDGVHWRWS